MKVFTMGMIGLVAVGLLLAASSQAADITVNWAASTAAIEQGGTPLPIGDLVQIGFMTGASNNIANFTPWASGAIGDNFSLPGVFSVSSALDEGSASHQQIYMVAYDAASPSANFGIFASLGDPNWLFPASSDFPNSVSLDLGDAGVSIIVGSAGIPDDVFGDGSVVVPGYNIQGAAVPEPSSIMLAAVGLLGLVGLIRRRS